MDEWTLEDFAEAVRQAIRTETRDLNNLLAELRALAAPSKEVEGDQADD